MTECNFEILEQDWFKRRAPDVVKKVLTAYEVIGFEKVNGHTCTMKATVDGEEHDLRARVYCNEIYTTEADGTLTTKITSWGVQGTSPYGVNVVLRLVE